MGTKKPAAKAKKANPSERREFPRVNKWERREYQRVIVKLETEVQTGKKYQISGWTRDLSVKGVYVICTGKLPLGARCKCKLCLGNVLKGAPVIEVTGKIVRCDDLGVALQFSNVAVECFKGFRNYFGPSLY